MKTLKEISGMFPGNYRVIDPIANKTLVKSWNDRIEIVVDGKSKNTTRKLAYKHGLCEGVSL